MLRRPESNSNVYPLQIDAVSDKLSSFPTPFSFPHDLDAPDAPSPLLSNHVKISVQVVRAVKLGSVATAVESECFVLDWSACQVECKDCSRRVDRKAKCLMNLCFAEQIFNIGSNMSMPSKTTRICCCGPPKVYVGERRAREMFYACLRTPAM